MKFRKKMSCFMLAIMMSVLSMGVVYADDYSVSEKDVETVALREGYSEIMRYASQNNIPLNMTLDTFIEVYNSQAYKNVDEYLDSYYALLVPMNSDKKLYRSSGGSKYYYNIGNSLPSSVTPNYSKYNLLSSVQKGDVIYESKGGYGITGHIAIVEGIFYDSARGITYIRIIEAIDVGVCRGLLDDTRVDEKGVSVLRVKGASLTDKEQAITFCIGEIGSSYMIDFQKDTSSSETDWYCSELVWAGYYRQGINIEKGPFLSEPGVTPRDIYQCNQVYSVGF